MTTTQLMAVPQPSGFRERAMHAMETHQGIDLISFVSRLHDQDMAEVVEQAVSARNALAQVATAATIDQHMLGSVMDLVRPMLRQSAENSARTAHYAGVIEAVRALLNHAENGGGMPNPEDLRRALDITAAPSPHRSLVIGFVPSTQYRVGHFRHVDSNVEWHLPFSGYNLCEEHPERPMTVHVAFLHKGVVRPRPQLYAEHGLIMEHME